MRPSFLMEEYAMSSWQVITHTMPDLDALSATAAVFWICERPQPSDVPTGVSFWDGANAPPFEHAPHRHNVIVDIGGAHAFDHHHLSQPRSTCAFNLVVEHFAASPVPTIRQRALAIAPLKPFIHRQDSTGAIFGERDRDRRSIASALRASSWQASDDRKTWQCWYPVFAVLFDTVEQHPNTVESMLEWNAIAHAMRQYGVGDIADETTDALEQQIALSHAVDENPEILLPHLNTLKVFGDSSVVAYAFDATVGAWSPILRDREALARLYPNACVLVSNRTWRARDGRLCTVSLNVGQALTPAGRAIDIRHVYRFIFNDPHVGHDLHAELASWYVESWFAGRGSMKRPALRPAPANFLQETACAVARAVERLTQSRQPCRISP